MDIETKKQMEKSGYRIVGKGQHSAVKICEWTKKSLIGKGVCYKEKWYGIRSHRCVQCSLCLFCFNKCLYCWRSFNRFSQFDIRNSKIDEPEEIIKEMISAQRELLTGFGGNSMVNKKRLKEAQNPKNFAISLIGESLLYPKISEFIEMVNTAGGSTFLVTKGTIPEALEMLTTEPTNLYISICAPDKGIFKKLENPILKDCWERQMKSLEIANSFICKKVIRITAVKGWNMIYPDKYAKLIHIMEPDFIEVKAYMHVGESQNRLPRSAMPLIDDVVEFAKSIEKETGYYYADTFKPSRVILLSKKRFIK